MLGYADDTTLMAQSEELKSLLMKVKEESGKVKAQHSEKKDHGIRSHHFMANGKTVETVSDFILGGSKVTAHGDYSHEIKRRLLLERKVMTNLDSNIKKQRHYFANKDPSSQGYGFSSSPCMDVRVGL